MRSKTNRPINNEPKNDLGVTMKGPNFIIFAMEASGFRPYQVSKEFCAGIDENNVNNFLFLFGFFASFSVFSYSCLLYFLLYI